MSTISLLLFLLSSTVVIGTTQAKLSLTDCTSTSIPNNYIVLYRSNATQKEMDSFLGRMEATFGSDVLVKHKYNIGGTFKGFAGNLSNLALASLLQNDDEFLTHVYCDNIETIANEQACSIQQETPSWGIARVSHTGPPTDLPNEYSYKTPVPHPVHAYILDTGIFIDHPDFEGRAAYGANFISGEEDKDLNGHGTHCAGTVGGATFGIAKTVKLLAVKVLSASGSGATSGVIAGIQYVTDEYVQHKIPSVASMSLGSSSDGGKNAAINASVTAGVIYSVAAGNSNGNACNYYPASSAAAITVGATELATSGSSQVDSRSTFSNYGLCVDVFAPGTAIVSAALNGGSATYSGTSMACPHVTGVVANLLGHDPSLTPTKVKALIVANAQVGLIRNIPAQTVNLLLYQTCDA